MTEKEINNLNEYFTQLCNSTMFNNVYQAILNSEEIIKVEYGETIKNANGENVPGQFVPDHDGKGGTITLDRNTNLSYATIAEEIYHSYQSITPNEQDKNTNFEYEAKVFTIGVCNDADLIFPQFKGLNLIESNVLKNKYGNGKNTYIKSNLNVLKNDYINNGSNFINSHIDNNSNLNYIVPITLMPNRLIKLIP